MSEQQQLPWWKRLTGSSPAEGPEDDLAPLAPVADPRNGPNLTESDLALLDACKAGGVTSSKQFETLARQAADGTAYGEEVNTFLNQQAVRLFGAAAGPDRAQNSLHLPVADRRAIANDWCDQADAKYGIGKNGEAPKRRSAPPALPVGRSAESTEDPDTTTQVAPDGDAAKSLNPISVYDHRRAQSNGAH